MATAAADSAHTTGLATKTSIACVLSAGRWANTASTSPGPELVVTVAVIPRLYTALKLQSEDAANLSNAPRFSASSSCI